MDLERPGIALNGRGRPAWIFCGPVKAGLGCLLLAVSGFAAETPTKTFDLPAGDALATLPAFSRQAGDEIIYPVEQLRAIKTNAVSGELGAREALDRMLSGTGFIAVQDEGSGALAVRRKTAPEKPVAAGPVIPSVEGRTVFLPPIYAEESRLTVPHWRYARLPDAEFLSSCDDVTTAQLIERIYHLNQRLEAFLPARFRVDLAVPTTFVLYDETLQPFDFQTIVDDWRRSAPSADPSHLAAEATPVRYLPNFRFAERDELAVFYVWKQDGPDADRIHLTYAHIRYLMEHRTPPLPAWFIDGMMALYPNSSLEVEPIYSGASSSFGPAENLAPKLSYGSVLIRLPLWMFGSEAKGLLDPDPHRKQDLLPMAALFSSPPPARGDALPGTDTSGLAGAGEKNARYISWWSQSALFIHWAFHRGEGEARAAFWRFVDRASVEPVTEAMFQEYFGLNYGEMNKTLAEYLPTAVGTPVRMSAPDSPDMPLGVMRSATDAEIGRIKGNLERLEVAYVQKRYPGLAPKYLAQTRHTLRRAYDRGVRDPGLLEVMGLCECDAGDDAAARPWLEAAVQAGALRPRAFYELARIKYQERLAKDASAKFDDQQTTELLKLLFSARGQSPPLPEVYELIASVWLHSTVAPLQGNLAVLDEGIRFFPGNLRLIYSAAVLSGMRGFDHEAAGLIKLGLRSAPEGPDRDRFLKLQSGSPAAGE